MLLKHVDIAFVVILLVPQAALLKAAGNLQAIWKETLAFQLRGCHHFRPPGFSPDGAIIPRLLRRSGKDGTS
jgi:hypothetical protein